MKVTKQQKRRRQAKKRSDRIRKFAEQIVYLARLSPETREKVIQEWEQEQDATYPDDIRRIVEELAAGQ